MQGVALVDLHPAQDDGEIDMAFLDHGPRGGEVQHGLEGDRRGVGRPGKDIGDGKTEGQKGTQIPVQQAHPSFLAGINHQQAPLVDYKNINLFIPL